MKKSAFSMIELIFVILIIGILAAIAIPKLSATKTDAEAAKIVQETQQIITEIISDATVRGGNLDDLNISDRSQTLRQLIKQGKGGTNVDSDGYEYAFIKANDGKRCISFWEYNATTLYVYHYSNHNKYSKSPECLEAIKILGIGDRATHTETKYNVSGNEVNF